MTPPPTNPHEFVYWVVSILCLVVIFLFALILTATRRCEKDRDELRAKMDINEVKFTALEVRTARAELLAEMPCHLNGCPRVGYNIKRPKVIEE